MVDHSTGNILVAWSGLHPRLTSFATMDFSKPLSTVDVPPALLGPAQLVDKVPFFASRADSRVSYCIFVPAEHYNPNPSLSDCGSPYDRPKLPLIVSIHGTSRVGESNRDSFIDLAKSEGCAVLAPVFPAGLDGPNDFDNYKKLRSRTLQADKVLIDIVDEVAARWPGIETERFYLVGFSGGGQFSHRFLYLYPKRLHAVSVGAPCQATLLCNEEWPAGIGNLQEVFGPNATVDIRDISSIPIQLVIGGNDIVGAPEALEDWLKEVLVDKEAIEEGFDERQVKRLLDKLKGRREVLLNLQRNWEKQGIRSQLDIVEGAGHNLSQVQPRVVEWLRLTMGKRKKGD